MTKEDIAQMADFVARAIYASCFEEGDEFDPFDELDEVIRGNYLSGAYAAMGAHDAWLTLKGFAIVETRKKRSLIVPERHGLVGRA